MIPGLICEGPPDADIMIVGEAPGENEAKYRQPFIGNSGQELSSMLHEAGIIRSSCFICNVVSERPPGNDIKLWFHGATEGKALGISPLYGRYPNDRVSKGLDQLAAAIRAINPRLIIALGDVALWALTGKEGITKWRGSVLPLKILDSPRAKVIPTFHPAAILRMWAWRWIAMQDLRRCVREAGFDGVRDPGWSFAVRPSFSDAMAFLHDMEASPRRITEDIETRGGQISCVGIATSRKEAFCIPFLNPERPDGNYWPWEEELALRRQLRRVNVHPGIDITFQNAAYDLQYFAKEDGYLVRVKDDTMLMQHVAFAGLRKSLDFQASLYCEDYCFWKDDGKEWNPRLHSPEQHWKYNCEDACRTFECRDTLDEVLHAMKLWPQYRFQMDRVFPAAFRMTLRGIKINREFRAEEDAKLEIRRREIDEWFTKALGHSLNPASSLQMKNLFYEDFNCQVFFNKKTKKPTLDDDALQKVYSRYPLLRPLLLKIAEWRSLGVFRNNFFAAELSPDNRMRCSFNLTGAETFRWSSSSDAFGTGTNLQNIPKDKPSKTKLTTGKIETLPNVRKMFVPDEDYIILEGDLQRADAQVVAWEADDDSLKDLFRSGADIHTENAKDIFHVQTPSYSQRQACKQGVHLTNYGGSARTLAVALGCTIAEAEAFQNRWFLIHPGVKIWQDDIMGQLMTNRFVQNKFGYRRFYFDRIDRSLLGQALAWIPQSTVALAINYALANINEQFTGQIEPLLQVHDSIVVQMRKSAYPSLAEKMHKKMLIEVPYDDPLIIPVTLAASDISWGHVEELHLEQAKVSELA